MLDLGLTHPATLAAIANAGHGAGILLCDGNYPISTAVAVRATQINLSISADLPTTTDLLKLIAPIVPIEGAAFMVPDDGRRVEAQVELARLVDVVPSTLSRQQFYRAARGEDLAVAILSGDTRHFANILLTVGVR